MAPAYLPAITVGLLLNFSTVVIAVPGIVFLAERPGLWQWGGVVLCTLGALIFFYPVSVPK